MATVPSALMPSVSMVNIRRVRCHVGTSLEKAALRNGSSRVPRNALNATKSEFCNVNSVCVIKAVCIKQLGSMQHQPHRLVLLQGQRPGASTLPNLKICLFIECFLYLYTGFV